MKQCTKCNQTKELTEFSPSSNKSGRASWCKACVTEKVLSYRGGRVFKQLAKTETHKQCRICEKMKPYSEFSGKNNKDSARKESYCTDCKKVYGTERVLKRYNMTIDDYLRLLDSQGGVCAICGGTESKRLSVDHDHACCEGAASCGKCVRGLLCSHCNRTLGMVKDDIDTLRRMIRYLSL